MPVMIINNHVRKEQAEKRITLRNKASIFSNYGEAYKV